MASLAACLVICLFINQALAFPLPVKHVLGTFGGPRVTWPELAFYSIFITAIIVSIIGAYIQSGMTEVRASAILRSFRRNAITRLRRLHALSPFAAFDDLGRAVLVPRRIPVRRGGLAFPVFRARRYPRQSHHVLPV